MVIFGTGVVTGGLLVRHVELAHLPRVQRPASPLRPVSVPSPGGMRLDLLRRMQRELELSPEQRERIDKILKESQERSKKIMEPVAPDLRQELQRTKEQFREVLRPDQRARFDELLKHPQRPQHRPATPTNSPPAKPVATN